MKTLLPLPFFLLCACSTPPSLSPNDSFQKGKSLIEIQKSEQNISDLPIEEKRAELQSLIEKRNDISNQKVSVLEDWEENEEEVTSFEEYMKVTCAEKDHTLIRDAAIFLEDYDSPKVDEKLKHLESCRSKVKEKEKRALEKEMKEHQTEWCESFRYSCVVKGNDVYVKMLDLQAYMDGVQELMDLFCISQVNGLFDHVILVTDTGNVSCTTPIPPAKTIEYVLSENGYLSKWESTHSYPPPQSVEKPDISSFEEEIKSLNTQIQNASEEISNLSSEKDLLEGNISQNRFKVERIEENHNSLVEEWRWREKTKADRVILTGITFLITGIIPTMVVIGDLSSGGDLLSSRARNIALGVGLSSMSFSIPFIVGGAKRNQNLRK